MKGNKYLAEDGAIYEPTGNFRVSRARKVKDNVLIEREYNIYKKDELGHHREIYDYIFADEVSAEAVVLGNIIFEAMQRLDKIVPVTELLKKID